MVALVTVAAVKVQRGAPGPPGAIGVKYIRYSRYTGEAADEVDLQELIKQLGDFFLQSGFESQYYGISEFDPDQTMETLRQAILRALAEGDLLPEDLLEQLTQQGSGESEEQLHELVDRLIERLMQEGYINGQTPPQITQPPDKMPRGTAGGQREQQNRTRFEITDKTIDFLGFSTLKDLLGSLGQKQLRAA